MTGYAVVAAPAPWRVAAAELPLSVHAVGQKAEVPAGAIVVEQGTAGWGQRVRAAAEGGAAALVVDGPMSLARAELNHAQRASDIAPVLIARGRVPTEVVATVPTAATRAIVIECTAPRAGLLAAACDAIAWAEALTGGPAAWRGGGGSGHGAVLALSMAAPGGQVAVAAVLAAGNLQRLRVTALGEIRREVDVATSIQVTTADEHGTLVLPPRRESYRRAALRRAVTAVAVGDAVDDVADLARQHEIASRVLSSRP